MKIYAFLNSKNDLSEMIEFDSVGHKIRSVKYSASYNKRTRKNKRIDRISYFKYDSQMKLIQIIDSVSYNVNNTYFYYDTNGMLINTKRFEGTFDTPSSETYYYTNPYRSTTTRRNDSSIITYNKTKEYDKDFYVNKFYGYYLEAKLKTILVVNKGDTLKGQYSDYSDMQRFEDTEQIKNVFNSKGQLVSSKVKSVFMNDRELSYKLTYKYYANGLLMSIEGYIPEFFRYEFYK